jgi:hypothetical protein
MKGYEIAKELGVDSATVSRDIKYLALTMNLHKAILGHCKMIMEKDGGRMVINPDRFNKLITALTTTVDNDGVLYKEATSYDDIFDAFRLAGFEVLSF